MEVDAKNQHERAVKFDFHTGVDELPPLPQIGRDCDGIGRARSEEDLGQLRRAGLRQGPVELEEARRLAEPVDLALAQRRRRLADVVEGGGGFLLLAIARLCLNQPVSRVPASTVEHVQSRVALRNRRLRQATQYILTC